MKRSTLLASAAVLALAAGCQTAQKPVSSGADSAVPLTDISPAPPPAYQPVSDVPVTPAPVLAGGGAYVVQRGDTLYKIARDHYGDGKEWQKIAAANPSITGTLILPGQRLVLP
jgi:5'-nucleotidase / UDP-sugar diphosphatase